jgi:hypothetical protein
VALIKRERIIREIKPFANGRARRPVKLE